MTEGNLSLVRHAWGKVRDIPDDSPAMARAWEVVSKMDAATRSQVEQANIRWLAPIARAIRTDDLNSPLKHSGGHPRDNGRGWL